MDEQFVNSYLVAFIEPLVRESEILNLQGDTNASVNIDSALKWILVNKPGARQIFKKVYDSTIDSTVRAKLARDFSIDKLPAAMTGAIASGAQLMLSVKNGESNPAGSGSALARPVQPGFQL